MEWKKLEESLSQSMAVLVKARPRLSNGRRDNGTHHREVRRLEIGDRRMMKNSCDSRRENKLIKIGRAHV